MKDLTPWYLDQFTRETWAWVPAFTKNECDEIIEIFHQLGTKDGTIEGEQVNEGIRKSQIQWLPMDDYKWIYERLAERVSSINKTFWDFDIEYIEPAQLTMYGGEDKSFYGRHTDHMHQGTGSHRKLSMSIPLSDPSEFEGGELLFHDGFTPLPAKQEKGTAVAFPSYVLHEVTPVTSGTRYSLVVWACGPKFK
jgi:PKHD-type hydroxylase